MTHKKDRDYKVMSLQYIIIFKIVIAILAAILIF